MKKFVCQKCEKEWYSSANRINCEKCGGALKEVPIEKEKQN